MISRNNRWRQFILSLIVISTLSSKVIHLILHIRSVPRHLFLLYLPTFFITDALLFATAWVLLFKTSGIWSTIGTVVTGALGTIDLAAASSQLGFYYVTGAEVRWKAASTVAGDTVGLKLLLSGLVPVLFSAFGLAGLAWCASYLIAICIDRWMTALLNSSIFARLSLTSTDDSLPLGDVKETQAGKRQQQRIRRWTALAALVVIVLRVIRPPVPYNHMSDTLPFLILRAFTPPSTPQCHPPQPEPFPLSEVVAPEFWERPHGHFKGWMPGAEDSDTKAGTEVEPRWLPDQFPGGFNRWALKFNRSSDDERSLIRAQSSRTKSCPVNEKYNTYDPVKDPMRISNLDLDLLAPLKDALREQKVPINHIIFIEMESARKDVFPLQYGSHLHEKIIQSHGKKATPDKIEAINKALSVITPVAEQLTGESNNFPQQVQQEIPKDIWRDTAAPGMGGINVVGALTSSSLSFKSALSSHCGVGPLPLDFLWEVHGDIYQPCLPQLLELFNRLRPDKENKSLDDFRQREWNPIFIQSVTGEYDQQNRLNRKMGFRQSIVKEDIELSSAKYFHPGMEEVNYFGYPEIEIRPYLRDIFNETIQNKQRLFLSHFTSTTHHPWGVPSDFLVEKYFRVDSLTAQHEDFNNYLNTIRYVDRWLGEILKLIDEFGIANETLVVFVGDHGQAFREDCRLSGTYENGHISNHRVPIVFRHPLLPRVQVSANATSISILPTILDLLINTGSLDPLATEAALDLIHEYEGQSLIRPFRSTHNGRQAWTLGVVNPGGHLLSINSAAVPYRVVMPFANDYPFQFSNLEKDPYELDVLEEWHEDQFFAEIERVHGQEARNWAVDALKVARWWVEEKKRLWNWRE